MMHGIDLSWANDSYLWSDDRRRLRQVQDLDRLTADTLRAGARVLMVSELPDGRVGVCDRGLGVILLAARLFDHEPWFFRRVLSHELGHIYAGSSEESACAWQRRYYGDVIEPEWTI